MPLFRHLPPTAAPHRKADLLAGLVSAWSGAPRRLEFDAALADYFSVPHAYAVDSGRTALRLILETVKADPVLQGRQEVVLPAYTCPMLVGVIRDAGLRPVPCDLVPETLDFDEAALRCVTSEATLAIVHVHPFGLPHSPEVVRAIATTSGAVVIDDACQAMGARWEGRPAGALGELGFASFGPGKPLSLGGGGVVLLNNPMRREGLEKACLCLELPTPIESLLAWARLALTDQLFRPVGWWLAIGLGLHRMGDDARNWKYRLHWMTPAQATIGLRSISRLEELNTIRRHNGQALRIQIIQAVGLAGSAGVTLPSVPTQAAPIFLRFPLLVSDADRRESIYHHLWDSGIGVGKMYQKTLPEIFPDLPTGPFPGAEAVSRHLLTLPTHPFVTPSDVDTILRILCQLN